MQSNAVSQADVSSVVGYLLGKGYFNPNSPNLPQNISILAEANTANQSALSVAPQVITNSVQAAAIGGNGSPIHSIASILFPQTGTGVTCPVTVYPQAAAGGAVAKVITVTQTGTATIARTINLVINGRSQVNSVAYAINVAIGDTPTIFSTKAQAAILAVLAAPVIPSGTATLVATAKWAGLTSNDINIAIDQNPNNVAGGNQDPSVTFAIVNTTAGAGTPSIGSGAGGTTGLDFFNNAWNTIVINSYGLVSAPMVSLETYNGIPDPVNPTGQYSGTIWRPMFALSGTCLDDPTSITSAGVRPSNVTIVSCVAPLSAGMPYEAAGNVARIIANVFANNPESDVIGMAYPDMPPPPLGSVPQMTQQAFRDYCVKRGCSTVNYTGGTSGQGVYEIVDLVTTYNLPGENPPFYRWVRDMNVHFNYKYGYKLLQKQKCYGKTLLPDGSTPSKDTVIMPAMWKAEVAVYNTACEARALLVNTKTNNKTIQVQIGSNNQNRMDTVQNYQISGTARVLATTSDGGFFFGSN